MAPSLPPTYGHTFTPTTHSTIPPNLTPTAYKLPTPTIVAITGAGKGLGYHISLAYALAGCTGLSISSRTMSDLDNLETALLDINPKLAVLKTVCDTQDEGSVKALAEEVRRKWGRVDVVKDGGGSGPNLPVGLLEDSDWARVLDINLLGTWRISKAFLPLLIQSKDGPQTLICSTSLAAHSTSSHLCPIAYNISKLACNRLIEHIANDHGAEGVCAYALHPGAVLTPQTRGHRGEAWGELLSDDERLAGAMCVWLSGEKRAWLSGRYVSCNWDVGELEAKKTQIVQEDLLKFRMAV
ncbi:NAD(P)-binding protein [Lentithecium fluviatile CBS 122367]|uniref:NAD(P)-binding protein n=1 Tax=Lentithecium fluviatile CBS 122367 TaxID=1168545 RepID=A0A6G1INX5_9PLEO|nr:NAD(P)-binding protein [Lentithecium fluviatile CBS 122367]